MSSKKKCENDNVNEAEISSWTGNGLHQYKQKKRRNFHPWSTKFGLGIKYTNLIDINISHHHTYTNLIHWKEDGNKLNKKQLDWNSHKKLLTLEKMFPEQQ